MSLLETASNDWLAAHDRGYFTRRDVAAAFIGGVEWQRKRQPATPSRLTAFKDMREQMDKELDGALSEEQARKQGLEPLAKKVYPVRIWNNVVLALAEREKFKERGAVLVWRRDRKDVQVWGKPEIQS